MNRLVKCLQPLHIWLVGIFALSLLLGGVATVMAKGNRTCAEIGDYECSSARVNYNEDTGEFDNTFDDSSGNDGCGNDISVTVTDDTYVEWESTIGIGAVIVKGGPSVNVYVYDQEPSDSGLIAPINPNNDKPFGLSNLTFCWNPETPGA